MLLRCAIPEQERLHALLVDPLKRELCPWRPEIRCALLAHALVLTPVQRPKPGSPEFVNNLGRRPVAHALRGQRCACQRKAAGERSVCLIMSSLLFLLITSIERVRTILQPFLRFSSRVPRRFSGRAHNCV